VAFGFDARLIKPQERARHAFYISHTGVERGDGVMSVSPVASARGAGTTRQGEATLFEATKPFSVA
jgi:hypothetical protein